MPQEENGPVPQQEEFGSGQPKLADEYRHSDEGLIRQQIILIRSHFEEQQKMLNKFMDDVTGYFEQHAATLEQDARQPRLAMEADGHANTKTRERTEGAATVAQAMRGDSFTACRVDPTPNTISTNFGVKAEPPALPCRDGVMVESGDAAPKSCLPFLEMRTTTAAGGLVPISKTSTATETNFNQSPLRFYSTEEMDSEANCKRSDSIRFLRQQLLETACFPVLPEGR